MHYPKTGELPTYWTNHVCEDPDCPGRRRTEKRRANALHTSEWIRLEEGRKKARLSDGTELEP